MVLQPEDLLDATLFLEDSPFAALAKHTVLEITERMSLCQITSDSLAGLRSRASGKRRRELVPLRAV
jgi:hypothetical protein